VTPERVPITDERTVSFRACHRDVEPARTVICTSKESDVARVVAPHKRDDDRLAFTPLERVDGIHGNSLATVQ
jgi:hypothetical protein